MSAENLAEKLPAKADAGETTDLLLLPDGRILVHGLTESFARLLGELAPDDEQFSSRIIHSEKSPQ